jgi:F-type H+-transporting ATPase subunit c
MKMRKSMQLLMGLALTLAATPVFAQAPSVSAPATDLKWIWIAAGFSMAIASAGCAMAQGRATAAAAEGLARNPGARPGIQLALILGLALIESLALYTLVIIFAKVKPSF